MSASMTRKLGYSDIFIHHIGFGTWPLSREGRPSDSESLHVLLAALDAGIDFFDTADAYCRDQSEAGYSERMLAKALSLRKQAAPFIATKGGCLRPNGAWEMNGTRKHLSEACDASLKALQVDSIDLYQLHAPDKKIPWLETVGILAGLKKAGKIRHIGLCNVSLTEIEEARKITDILSIQNECNPFNLRAIHEGIVPYCEQNNLAFIAYCPVNGPYQHQRVAQHLLLSQIAEKHRISSYQAALAWLLTCSSCLIPIPGSTKIEHVLSNFEARKVRLSAEQVDLLDREFGRKRRVIS